MKNQITISVELTNDQAEALSQLVKRISHDDCVRLSSPQEEPYDMLYATEQVAKALAEAGFVPR
jgi:hypothetical protein